MRYFDPTVKTQIELKDLRRQNFVSSAKFRINIFGLGNKCRKYQNMPILNSKFSCLAGFGNLLYRLTLVLWRCN